jgi:hypothetical protein
MARILPALIQRKIDARETPINLAARAGETKMRADFSMGSTSNQVH